MSLNHTPVTTPSQVVTTPSQLVTTPAEPQNVTTPSEPPLLTTPSNPESVKGSSKSSPLCSYERMVLQNKKEFKAQIENSTMKDISEKMRSFHRDSAARKTCEITAYPPKVVRVIEASNITTRQQEKRKIEMVGTLDDIEGKAKADKILRLTQIELEHTKRREELKRKNNWLYDCSDESNNNSPIKKTPLKVTVLSPIHYHLSKNSTISDSSYRPDEDDLGFSLDSPEMTPKKKIVSKVAKKTPTPKKTPKKTPTKTPTPKKIMTPKVAKKTPKKPEKKPSISENEKNMRIKPFKCNKCDCIYKAKPSVRSHFKTKHPEDTYKSELIKNLKFNCYECKMSFATFKELDNHFLKLHTSLLLNPKEVFLGSTDQTAFSFLKLQIRKPRPKLKLPNKSGLPVLPAKKKHFKCPHCDFLCTSREEVVQHKLLEHNKRSKEGNF